MASAFSSIKNGLNEAINFSEGKVKKTVVYEFCATDVNEIRANREKRSDWLSAAQSKGIR